MKEREKHNKNNSACLSEWMKPLSVSVSKETNSGSSNKGKKRVVLCEEDYLGTLEAIIQRDFFPSLSSDAITLDLKTGSVVSSIVSGDSALSLEAFFSLYQSDDNASFNALQQGETQDKFLERVKDKLCYKYSEGSLPCLEDKALALPAKPGAGAGAAHGSLQQWQLQKKAPVLIQNSVCHKQVNYLNTGFAQAGNGLSLKKGNLSHTGLTLDQMEPPPPRLPPGALRSDDRPYSYLITPDIGSGAELTPSVDIDSILEKKSAKRKRKRVTPEGIHSSKRATRRGGSGIFSKRTSKVQPAKEFVSLTPAAKQLALRLGTTPSSFRLGKNGNKSSRGKQRASHSNKVKFGNEEVDVRAYEAYVDHRRKNKGLGSGLTDGLLKSTSSST